MSESLLSPSVSMFESSMGALANNFKMTFGLKTHQNHPPPEPQGNLMSDSIAYQQNIQHLFSNSSSYSTDYISGSFLDAVDEISPPPLPEMFLDDLSGMNQSDIEYSENMLLLDSNGSLDLQESKNMVQKNKYQEYLDDDLLATDPSLDFNYGRLPSGVFQCNYPKCRGRGFLTLKDLKAHMGMAHSGCKSGSSSPANNKAKPFKCDLCPQTFSRSHDLKRHYYIHTDEKPYRCSNCKKGFSRRDALKRHEKSVSEGKKVLCISTEEYMI